MTSSVLTLHLYPILTCSFLQLLFRKVPHATYSFKVIAPGRMRLLTGEVENLTRPIFRVCKLLQYHEYTQSTVHSQLA